MFCNHSHALLVCGTFHSSRICDDVIVKLSPKLTVRHSQTTGTLHSWTSTPAVLEAWREYTPRSSFVMSDIVRLALTPSLSPSSLVDILVSVKLMGRSLCLQWVEGGGSPTARADSVRTSPGSRSESTIPTSLMAGASVGECQLVVP